LSFHKELNYKYSEKQFNALQYKFFLH